MRCACGHPSAADEALRYNVFHASFKAILNQYRLLHCSYVYAPYQASVEEMWHQRSRAIGFLWKLQVAEENGRLV